MTKPLDVGRVVTNSVDVNQHSPACKEALQDPIVLQCILNAYKSTAEMASGWPFGVVAGVATKAADAAHVTGNVVGSASLVAASAAGQIIISTAQLLALSAYLGNPGAALPLIGATYTKHIALLFGLLGGEDKRAKCTAALAEIATSALLVSAVSSDAAGKIVMGGCIAQIILSAYQAGQALLDKEAVPRPPP